ncbi:MAG: NADH-quinone oxidoreductase subunit L [Bryobacteraceae bacterium]
MGGLLWLVPALPFAGAAILLVLGGRMPKWMVPAVGCGSILASAIVIAGIFAGFTEPYTQRLWTWIGVGGFRAEIAFYLDSLSLVMATVVAWVGFLIHVYSAEYMREDPGYSRFFGYMNLFVGSMQTLLLANNLLLLYLGWEGVGLCSYLLIGFWYQDPANGRAGQKAFIVTRVGDAAMAIGLFLLFHSLGTLEIQPMLQRAAGSASVLLPALLLVGGAVGKSAQLPLQVWLPDAMAGPTPTSALIHAATMVTAGVYLIARTHTLFTLAPEAQLAVAIIGAATLLMAGFSALVQHDMKRILAYSTVSQIGYMFLALGVGAWPAAIFHFMTHAFFKALLFLAAGVVIEALHHEHDIFRMGGLRRELPVTFWTFLIGGCALAGLPLVTAGYYSKDLIIWGAANVPRGAAALWIAAIVGVFMTALYTFRQIFAVFFGPLRTPVTHRPGPAMTVPLVILAALALGGGALGTPLMNMLARALPHMREEHGGALTEHLSGLIASAAFAAGLLVAYIFFLRRPRYAEALANTGAGRVLHRWWHADWGMDWLYDRLFVRPVLWVARVNRGDFVDSGYRGLAAAAALFNRGLSATQSGRVRWYAAGLALGSVVFVAVAMLL